MLIEMSGETHKMGGGSANDAKYFPNLLLHVTRDFILCLYRLAAATLYRYTYNSLWRCSCVLFIRAEPFMRCNYYDSFIVFADENNIFSFACCDCRSLHKPNICFIHWNQANRQHLLSMHLSLSHSHTIVAPFQFAQVFLFFCFFHSVFLFVILCKAPL